MFFLYILLKLLNFSDLVLSAHKEHSQSFSWEYFTVSSLILFIHSNNKALLLFILKNKITVLQDLSSSTCLRTYEFVHALFPLYFFFLWRNILNWFWNWDWTPCKNHGIEELIIPGVEFWLTRWRKYVIINH